MTSLKKTCLIQNQYYHNKLWTSENKPVYDENAYQEIYKKYLSLKEIKDEN